MFCRYKSCTRYPSNFKDLIDFRYSLLILLLALTFLVDFRTKLFKEKSAMKPAIIISTSVLSVLPKSYIVLHFSTILELSREDQTKA